MARRSLEDLLAEDTAGEAAVPAPPPPAPARELRSREKAPERPDSGSPEVPETGGSRSAPTTGLAHRSEPKAKASPRAKRKAAPAAPKWTTLERKDALLWQEQIEALTDLRRDLQRRKRREGGGGERITENTLIRVAIAALLEHRDALTGKDETELRESLISALRDSRTPEVQE